MALVQPPLIYGITDSQLLPGEQLFEAVDEATQAGVRWIQYRVKNAPFETREAIARKLLDICSNNGATLIVNDDPYLAKAVQAPGVHLGQNDMSVSEARALLGSSAIIGATCHDSLLLAQNAQAQGASYVAFGRFFASATKPQAPLADLAVLQQARQSLDLPIVAIGGITSENAQRILQAGADGLAVCNGLFEGNAVKSKAKQLLSSEQFYERI